MTLQRYERYKESGIAWLGAVPERWEFRRLYTVCSFESGMAHEPYIDDSGEFICVNARFISTGGESQKFCTKNLSPAKKDDVLIVMSDLPNGRALAKAFFVKEDGPYAVNQRVCILSPRTVCPKYLYYYLDRNPELLSHDDGMNQTHLWNDLFRKLPILLPPYGEQEVIASFLDRETAKIDALIDAQRRLVDLLMEKRQAVISHAVTKGLSPGASMKPSGIDWLGNVPVHWKVTRIKRLAMLISKGTTPTTVGHQFQASGIRFVKGENIRDRRVSQDPEAFISVETHRILARSALMPNDILVVIAGTIGKAAVMDQNFLPANTSQAVSFIRLYEPSQAPFVNYWFATEYVQTTILLKGVQSAQPNLSMEDLGNLPVAVPPKQELEAVVRYLNDRCAYLGRLITDAESSIALLQERRSALISAAVTGKIDVRKAFLEPVA